LQTVLVDQCVYILYYTSNHCLGGGRNFLSYLKEEGYRSNL